MGTMINEMMGIRGVPCDLALLRGPKDFVRRDPNFPGIRSGLYVGDYGHTYYGQFRTEVLLVEYVTMTRAELEHELESSTRIFERPACSNIRMSPGRAPPAIRSLLDIEQEEVTFVRG